MSSWNHLLEHAQPEDHFVQLYGVDDRILARNVARYLGEGLRSGDGLVVIATPAHAEAILRHLHEDRAEAARATQDGRLVTLDARDTLDRILVDGQPSRERFLDLVGGIVQQSRRAAVSGMVRAFGEMVGLLWMEGRREAAARLEEHWTELLQGSTCSLFCAYPVDIFEAGADLHGVDTVLCAHTHLCAGYGTMLTRTAR